MKGYGERLSPSPIYYIIVIVKKGQPCVAQVIFVIHSNSDPKPPSIWRAHISGRGGGGCRVGRRTTKQPHQRIEEDSKFCFKMNLF